MNFISYCNIYYWFYQKEVGWDHYYLPFNLCIHNSNIYILISRQLSLKYSRYFYVYFEMLIWSLNSPGCGNWNAWLLVQSTHFQIFKSEVEKMTGRHVRCLRSDGGKEYFSDDFTAYLRKEGIRQEFTCRHTPQQNGVAERKNRHILEVARAMMNEKHMPKSNWLEAANTVV